MKSMQLPEWCSKPVDPRMLGLYRIGYGLFMIFMVINYFRIDLIGKMFVEPKLNFSYDYLGWIKPMPEVVMHIILGVMLLSAVAISLGVVFKWSCRIFALGYAYIFLIDKGIYNNHIYLFILLAILLSFTNADCCYSLKPKQNRRSLIPKWQILILQLQIVIVYFYGGLAKLTKDWLIECQPVRALVEQLSQEGFLSFLFKNEISVYILNYGGLLIDLGAPLLLWYKPVRRWGIFLFIGFNIINSRIFSDIGIFPYVMLVSLFLFYEVSELPWLSKLLGEGYVKKKKNEVPLLEGAKMTSLKFYGISLFIFFQLLFPFRGHFLPNDLDWTTIGNRFSWRMKVDTRRLVNLEFLIDSPDFPDRAPVDIQTFVNDVQIRNISMDPRSVLAFSKFLREEAIKYNTNNPTVFANIEVEYNGRSPQYFVQPDVDLSRLSYSPFVKQDWIVPIKPY